MPALQLFQAWREIKDEKVQRWCYPTRNFLKPSVSMSQWGYFESGYNQVLWGHQLDQNPEELLLPLPFSCLGGWGLAILCSCHSGEDDVISPEGNVNHCSFQPGLRTYSAVRTVYLTWVCKTQQVASLPDSCIYPAIWDAPCTHCTLPMHTAG